MWGGDEARLARPPAVGILVLERVGRGDEAPHPGAASVLVAVVPVEALGQAGELGQPLLVLQPRTQRGAEALVAWQESAVVHVARPIQRGLILEAPGHWGAALGVLRIEGQGHLVVVDGPHAAGRGGGDEACVGRGPAERVPVVEVVAVRVLLRHGLGRAARLSCQRGDEAHIPGAAHARIAVVLVVGAALHDLLVLRVDPTLGPVRRRLEALITRVLVSHVRILCAVAGGDEGRLPHLPPIAVAVILVVSLSQPGGLHSATRLITGHIHQWGDEPALAWPQPLVIQVLCVVQRGGWNEAWLPRAAALVVLVQRVKRVPVHPKVGGVAGWSGGDEPRILRPASPGVPVQPVEAPGLLLDHLCGGLAEPSGDDGDEAAVPRLKAVGVAVVLIVAAGGQGFADLVGFFLVRRGDEALISRAQTIAVSEVCRVDR
mmetsp:Transcript_10544/g.18645  ORF Transcript_10544/g.18645 Transcript_10544/m.18645 type:complete len:432 (+) Transcript_10544:1264-2559(+)